MPKLIVDGKVILVRWRKEWDKRIYLIEKNFRKKGGFVDWVRAFECGQLKGLPALKLHDYSHRLTALKMMKKPDYKEKRRKYNETYKIQSTHGAKIRLELFRGDSLNPIRQKFGCPHRETWTEQQHLILKVLTNNYRKGLVVDWAGVMSSFLISFIPVKYQNNLSLLRKYYHIFKRFGDKDVLQKRRDGALKWRNENKDRYLKNVLRRKKKITQVAQDYFLEKVPLFQ